MAGSVNKVILVGNLGRDPEIKRMPSGDAIVNFSIATSETWRDKQTGERKEKTEWHRIVIFNEGLAKIAEQYLRKGSKVYLEGQLQTREWQDKDGTKRSTTEVVLQRYRGEMTLLDGRNDGAASGGGRDSMDDGGSSGSVGYDRGSNADRGGYDRGGSDRGSANRGGGAARPSSASRSTDMDDDIPF